MWPLCLISTSHAREPCLSRITQNSVCSRFEFGYLKCGVLKNVFILSKHGAKANIRSTKMAINRHAYNRDVHQSYWMSDGLPLYCSQPTGEKTHTNHNVKDLRRSGRPRVTSDRDNRALQHLVRRMPFATSPVLKQHWLSTRTIDVYQQEQLETVWNQRDLSQGESLNVHCCQTDIDDHVWHGV